MKQREDRWWNFPAVLILYLALLVTTFRIESTGWAAELSILKYLTFVGFLIGLGLGYSNFKSSLAGWLGFIYSIFIVPWALATTYEKELSWLEIARNLSGRIGESLNQLFNGVSVQDPILFITLMSILIWITAILGGYRMTRHGKPWIALFISGVTIFVSEFYYVGQHSIYTGIFIIFVLILLSMTNFMHAVKDWRSKGTLVEFETVWNISRTALIGGIILVLVAWNATTVVSAFTPGSVEQKRLTTFFENIRNELARITAPLAGPLIISQEYYGESVGLGTGAILGDDLVFEIDVDGFRPDGSRYYWRARTYDLYLNDQWRNSTENEIPYQADEETRLKYPVGTYFEERTFTFHTSINLGLLYSPTYPKEISRSVNLIGEVTSDGLDLVAIPLERTIFSGESYEITGVVTNPTVKQMRDAPAEYPDWVLDKYLQLPDDFPDRIRELAAEVTQGKENPYDKAISITNYLRRTIEYTEQIPTPPKNEDPIEWFLFENKAGFCNYYATAEVLMLRSVGVPARMVFGYAQGEGSQNNTLYEVKRKQSHAWPEVFFPEIGWIEFEPTAGQPVLTRRLGSSGSSSSSDTNEGERLNDTIPMFDGRERPPLPEDSSEDIREIDIPDEAPAGSSLVAYLPLLIVIGLIALVALIILRRRRIGIQFAMPAQLDALLEKRGWHSPAWLRRWAQYIKLSDYEKAFSSIGWSLFIMRQPVSSANTPAELVREFSICLPTLEAQAQALLEEYQKAFYSPYTPDLPAMQQNASYIIRQTIKVKLRSLITSEDKEEVPA